LIRYSDEAVTGSKNVPEPRPVVVGTGVSDGEALLGAMGITRAFSRIIKTPKRSLSDE